MRSLRLLCAALAVAVVPVIAAVPTQATARATAPARQTVVPGVQVWVQHWTTPNGSPERSSLMTVDLTNPHLRVVARSAYRVVGGAYQPVSTMIRQDSAIGGINGDFFDLGTRTGVPDGGIVRNGTILKTPQPGRNANLYLRTDGTAAIGPAPFAGQVWVKRAVHHPISSVNTLSDAEYGGLTMITPAMDTTPLPSRCALVIANRGLQHAITVSSVVASTRRRTTLTRLGSKQLALLGCGGSASWLRTSLSRGRHATASVAFTTAHIATLVSGARVVLRGGVPVDDPTARAIQGQHAETFACVSQDARHLLFGAVDMLYWWQESGVSLVQLRYYLQQLGCWTAIELDGGGSSTLDYRMPGSTQVVTVNHPADGSERWIPDALLVYRH